MRSGSGRNEKLIRTVTFHRRNGGEGEQYSVTHFESGRMTIDPKNSQGTLEADKKEGGTRTRIKDTVLKAAKIGPAWSRSLCSVLQHS